MRTRCRTNKAQDGSVLVTTLVLSAILGLTLAGYLYWVRTQNILVAQSQAWNAALAYAEAGIEEGMAQINAFFHTNYTASAQANWGGGYADGHFGPRTHNFTDGSYTALIEPIIGAPGPTIISTGYCTVPLVGKTIARTIRVTTTTTSPFGNAITVRSNLTAVGTGMTIDSYDSSDSLYSTLGMYDPLKRKAGGDVNSTDGLIAVQNAEIYGHVRTGPGGTFEIGNGSVGDLNWNVKGQVQDGWYANDFNMEIKEVLPPCSTGTPVAGVSQGTGTVYPLGSGTYYQEGDFVLSQNESLVVTGNATFYVTGNFNMKSQNACSISIQPGCNLKLYVGTRNGPNTFAALTKVNTTGNAYTFQFYGLNSTKTMSWGGNDAYVGTIYAPEANLTLSGGGSTYYDYQGACVAKSATLNGHFNIHYDENLRRISMPTGFNVASWREL